MTDAVALSLREQSLKAGSEWTPPGRGWCAWTLRQGTGYWRWRRTAAQLDTGDLAVVPLLPRGVFQTSQLGSCVLIYFRLSLEQLVGLLSTRERTSLEAQLLAAAPGGRFFRAGHPLAQRFQAILERDAGLQLWTRFQCLGLFAEVFAAEFEQVRSRGRLALTARDRFDHWAAGVSEPELRKASVEELARRCGCSARHFSRLFRDRFGLSLNEAQFPRGSQPESLNRETGGSQGKFQTCG